MTSGSDLVSFPTDEGRATTEAIIDDPSNALICLDFDGTLAPIVVDPQDARPDPEAMAALERLLTRVGRVAIVTGRPVDVALQLGGFAMLPDTSRLRVFGQYGAETWNGATGHIHVPAQPPAIGEAKLQIERMLADLSAQNPALRGTAIEDKGLAIGVHTRRAADPAEALVELTPRLDTLADRLGLITEPGRNVVELRAGHSDKGDVVAKLLDDPSIGAAAFCGDDLGDISAFAVLIKWRRRTGRRAACVVSASDEVPSLRERADVLCEGPSGIAAWLTSLTSTGS
ncbi:Trehalose-phosphatase (Trehalose 6-phosphate phosphatase) [Propionibacterium freudenreichii subsp. freudenreichii]|uniref:Trehalose 6-phosphate phosphatase n=1 Tax=Propionibacterium freudenreichii subsp. freudenreichii TaxID=66712 RepID=A0A0B7NYJ9_PROFF|nr:Trehalose-phosphatase (Trehalose 6-phosphate phosphatase) [Propionibacterium freudenreichii subsp. freudenreichii]